MVVKRQKPNAEFVRRYTKKNLVISKERDGDVLKKLASVQSENDYILSLIRQDIQKEEKNVYGIHHVCVKCINEQEYEEVKNFYINVIGLPVKREWVTGIMLDTGNGLLEIFNNGDEKFDKGVIQHFALAVHDVDSLVEKVKEAGYEVFVEPKEICIPSEIPFPARIAFCKGPLGEEIELFNEHSL
ncbi:MAG: VOC family protein [Firmicutes bacterium]|nr:VOC family protein [Bacillota bacterium]